MITLFHGSYLPVQAPLVKLGRQLEYVVDCRRGGLLQQQFDIVEGGVANDNVIDTVEDYEKSRDNR